MLTRQMQGSSYNQCPGSKTLISSLGQEEKDPKMRRYYLCKAPSNLQKCKFNWKKVTSVENAFGRVSYRKTSAQGSLFTGLTTKSEKAAATVEGLQPASSASTAELTVIYMALVCSHAKKGGGHRETCSMFPESHRSPAMFPSLPAVPRSPLYAALKVKPTLQW